MNILFLDQFSDLGGAQLCLLDVLQAVAAHGWSAHVAVPGGGRLWAEAKRLGATVDEIPCGPFAAGSKSLRDVARFAEQAPRQRRRITELARRYDVDLVYVNGPRLLPACDAPGCPALFHCHSLLQGLNAWMARRYVANLPIVASCRFVLQPFRGHPRTHVVYNGVEGVAPKRRHRGRRVGVIGRIAPEKGQAEFLAAARLVPDAQFVICGAPLFSDPRAIAYADRLRSLAEGLPVEFLGWRDDVFSVLHELDALVVPSMVPEATTRVILEAYAAGVPVVAAPSGGIAEVVEDGVTGFLADPRRPKALAACIRKALDSPSERMVERAHQHWRERYTLRRYQEQMIQSMEQAIGGGCARQSCTIG